MKLQGKVAIITGAGSGIGRATAMLFAEEGARVVVADIDERSAENVAVEIRAAGGHATARKVDVSVVTQLERMVDCAVQEFGRLDVFFSNAGVTARYSVDNLAEEHWDKAAAINLKAAVFGAKFAALAMKKTGGGSIIFTSSVAGLVGQAASPLYSTTKGGVRLLSKSLALALATDNIRVNAICPGPVETPLMSNAYKDGGNVSGGGAVTDWESARKVFAGMVPMGRLGRPEEIARAALFLASDDSSFVTGIDLIVDGGYTAK